LSEQKRNEESNVRCVGLTIETRSDYGFYEHGKEMLKLGCTRIELGVQTASDLSLKAMERGHTVNDSIRSIRELKDLGFKLNFHIMPGLIGSSKKKDIEMIKEIFRNPDFRPDMLKIYPCMVTKGTKLYELYKKGSYTPLSTKDACEIITKIYPEIPYYCRIMRIQRDIPTQNIVAGVDVTNLRQYIFESLKKEGKFSSIKEIRHREAGRIKSDLPTKLFIEKYSASKGTEFFISLESIDRKVLYGFCRLRLPHKNLALDCAKACEKKSIGFDSGNIYAKNVCDKKIALVRELHVYGTAINIGDIGEVQHKGYGKQLLKKAEELAKENSAEKILVISGIGVRGYYKKLGYRKYRTYMAKNLK
jgi:elongator complex protein 3